MKLGPRSDPTGVSAEVRSAVASNVIGEPWCVGQRVRRPAAGSVRMVVEGGGIGPP